VFFVGFMRAFSRRRGAPETDRAARLVCAEIDGGRNARGSSDLCGDEAELLTLVSAVPTTCMGFMSSREAFPP
jgi:hypothetical protein